MKVKQLPEDFVVKEIIDVKIEPGSYTYFKLKKKNWNTINAVKEIARRLKTKEKFLNYAGIKDKNAVTEQVISAYKVPKERLENLKMKDIELEVLGTGKEKVHVDLLKGNEFEITVRDLEKPSEKKLRFIPNYFDGQRFGINGKNHMAGKALMKKEFKEACELLNLEVKNNDYVGALKRNKRVLKLIFNSYQSYLFNLALAEYIRKKSQNYKEIETNFGTLIFSDYHDDISLPLIQFDTELDKTFEKILEKEKIRKEDFLIRQFPELLSQTQERKAFVEVKGFSSETEEDELNKGKIKQILRFSLPKGSYATIVVKFLYLK